MDKLLQAAFCRYGSETVETQDSYVWHVIGCAFTSQEARVAETGSSMQTVIWQTRH